MLCTAFIPTAFAADGKMSALEEKQGSLKITLAWQKEDDSKEAVSGAAIKLFRVAQLEVKGGSPKYTLLSPFTGEKISFDGITASASNEEAAALQKIAARENAASKKGVTGTDGTVDFDGLEPGMYLAYWENGNSGRIYMDPFLISIPLEEQTKSGSIWIWDVETEPKTTTKKPGSSSAVPTAPTTPGSNTTSTAAASGGSGSGTKTGDDTRTDLWIMQMGAACLVLCLVLLYRKKRPFA